LYRTKGGIGARGIDNEKPVFTELIIDAECMTLKREIDPSFCDAITDEFCERSSRQRRNMISNDVPILVRRQ
jgi:hypothetical protein